MVPAVSASVGQRPLQAMCGKFVCVISNTVLTDLFSKTTKHIHTILNERPIWHAVFTDLLTVKPLPYSSSDIENMSSEELRQASVRIVRVDEAYSDAKITPRPAHSCTVRGDCCAVQLLPGGERYISVHWLGEVWLSDLLSPTPVSTVQHHIDSEYPAYADVALHIYPQDLHSGFALTYVQYVSS